MVHLPQPDFGCATAADGVVFTATYDGTCSDSRRPTARCLALHAPGRRQRLPALAQGWLLVGAGVPRDHGSVPELTAFRLG